MLSTTGDGVTGSEGVNSSGHDSLLITSCPLSCPDDSIHLSGVFCFIRSQLEAFVVPPESCDRPLYTAGGKRMDVGRVGVRCIHCARANLVWSRNSDGKAQGGAVGKGTVLFPQSIRLMYQAVRNYQRYHLLSCPAMPCAVKERYEDLKSGEIRPRSGKSAPQYWEDSCRRLGMIDTESGIRLRTGGFVVGSENGRGNTHASLGGNESHIAAPTVSLARASEVVQGAASQQSLCNPPLEQVAEDCVNPSDTIRSDSLEIFERPANKHSPTLPLANLDGIGPSTTPLPYEHHLGIEVAPFLQEGIPFLFNDNDELGVSSENVMPKIEPIFGKPLLALDEQDRGIAATLSKEMMLERLRLAQSTVKTVAELSQVVPLHYSSKDDEAVGAQKVHESDMYYLGEELYELFSGRSPYDSINSIAFDEENDSACEDNPQQQAKRGKRREVKRYIPLRDFGLPSAVCSLVSSLLDYSSSSTCIVYNSIEEVEQDLRALASKPESLLFHTATGELDIAQDILYGRDEEVAMLISTYERVINKGTAGAKNMVLISGYSGTGKSALVNHARNGFTERGACFASGKFDAMQQLQPLSAIVSALDEYCGLLVQDGNRRERAREAIEAAIGSDGLVLADLVPNFRKIVNVGGHSSVHVSGREAMQRLMFQLRMMFRATCSQEHPVVFFLDDLQWADEMSLELMQTLVLDSGIRGFLFIGSYRDNEVDAGHPLSMHVDHIRSSCSDNIVNICVDNLDEKSVNSLVSDALHLAPQVARPLAQVVLSKTGGNALFAVQFIISLRDEGLLHFSLTSKQWEWDIDSIRGKEISDNVVELMLAKLRKLAPEVQSALSVAAGFGAQCNEVVLQILDNAPDKHLSTAAALDVAVAEGLMSKSGSCYQFCHDQIQHASYLLVPVSERAGFHLKIGRSLHEWSSSEEMNSFLFVVLDQLHRGSSLITDHKEKIDLSRLSLMAGQMASAMSAFLPAAAYFKSGIRLLAENDWDIHRNLCFDLYNSCAETECILGDFDETKGCVDEVLRRACTLKEKLQPYLTLVQALGSQDQLLDAINTALPLISQLGEPFPFIVSESMIKAEIASTQDLLRAKTEQDLVQLEEMVDTDKQHAMKYMQRLAMYVFAERREYFPIVACRMVRLSLLHGICRESAFGFATFGMILCGLLGDVREGYCFGKVAIKLMDKFQAQEYLARVFVVVHGFISPWVEPIQATLPCLQRAIDVGLATGNTDFAMIASNLYVVSALCSGKTLGPLVEETERYMKQTVEYNQHFTLSLMNQVHQAMLKLRNPSIDSTMLMGEEMNENSSFRAGDGDATNTYPNHTLRCFYSMWLEYLFGQYEKAWSTGNMNRDMTKHAVARFPYVCNHTFYIGLTALALARKEGKSTYNDCIESSIRQMKIWVTSNPWNCEHKLELMNAEYAYLEGDVVGAAEAYTKAIYLAAEHSFLHEQALALERTGIFYMERSERDTAAKFFTRAQDCYARWGACSKAAHVQVQYL